MQRMCTARDVLCSASMCDRHLLRSVSITGPLAVPADPGFTAQFYHSLGHAEGHVLFQPHSRLDGRCITYTLSRRVIINMPV